MKIIVPKSLYRKMKREGWNTKGVMKARLIKLKDNK